MSDDYTPEPLQPRADMPNLEQVADYVVKDLSNPEATPDEAWLDAVGDLDGLTMNDLAQLVLMLGMRLVNAQDHVPTMCIICDDSPTETGITFEGDAVFIIRAGMMLGLEQAQAEESLSIATDCPPGMVPQGVQTVTYRVCAKCSKAADPELPPPGPVSGQVPLFRQGDQS